MASADVPSMAGVPHGRDVDFTAMVLRVPTTVTAGKPRVMTTAMPDGEGGYEPVRFLCDPMEATYGLRAKFNEDPATTKKWEIKGTIPRGSDNHGIFTRLVARAVQVLAEHSVTIFSKEKSEETIRELMYSVVHEPTNGKITPPMVGFPVFRDDGRWSTAFLDTKGKEIATDRVPVCTAPRKMFVPYVVVESITLLASGKLYMQLTLKCAMMLPPVPRVAGFPVPEMRSIIARCFPDLDLDAAGGEEEEGGGGSGGMAAEQDAKRRRLGGEFEPASTALEA